MKYIKISDFVCGAGIIFSKDIIEIILQHKNLINYDIIDDVALGVLLHKCHKKVYSRYDIITLNNIPKDDNIKTHINYIINNNIFHVRLKNPNRLSDIVLAKKFTDYFYRIENNKGECENVKLKIVINSNNNGNIALNLLLESMKLCEEYNDYEIIIIVGGYYNNKDYEIVQKGNITYIHCNHSSFDFTGLITLIELFENSINNYYLYLHDTCRVGKDFYKKLQSVNLTNISSIKINKGASMNIGFYSQKILNKFKIYLLNKKNTDVNKLMEFKRISIQDEDYIFKNDKYNITLYNFYLNCSTLKPIDYYKTGTMRIVEYYNNLDLYKIKANWYIRDSYELNN